jgi:bleomycin hydrolase
MSITSEMTNNWLGNEIQPQQISMYNNLLSSLAKNNEEINNNPYLFNNEVSTKLPITNQESSGRCWLFATCNLIRQEAHKTFKKEYDLDVDDLELSQSYLFFWDKLERYHRNLRYYLQIQNDKENVNYDRYLYSLYQDPMSDGGQWDMAAEIVKKYGVVPKSAMPDSKHATSSREMNKILTRNLVNDWLTLSNTNVNSIESAIKLMMDKVYWLLVGFLGKPPRTFDWTFKSKKKILRWTNLTPLSFLEKTKFETKDWVSVIHDPRKENEYNKYYQVRYLGNTKNQHVGWLNFPIDRVKQLTKESIDNNYSVWFGCDVGNNWDRKTGVHSPDILKLKEFANLDFKSTKEDRLRTHSSLPNHAMVIQGYHTEDDEIKRWKIENSWGEKSGHKGFLLMTDKWFEEYLFQIVVHKKFLTKEEKLCSDQEGKMIEPWDPLGTLA